MPSSTSWRRVSPLAIIYFLLKGIPLLVNLWPALIGLWAAGESARGYFLAYGLPMVVVLGLVSVLMQYWSFRYRVEPGRIQLRSGVFNRKRLTLDLDRVQQADIAQPFYFRPFGLATLGLESAGSHQQEVDIPGLPVEQVEELRRLILEHIEAAPTSEQPATDASHERETDYHLHLPPMEIARYGLMQNTLLFLAPLAAPLGQSAGPWVESWLRSLEMSYLFQLFGNALVVAILVGLVAVLAGALALFGVSALLALVYYWGYDLSRRGERFQYRAGLLTLRTRGFRLHKLQKATVVQGVIARLLRRYTVQISKAGGSAGQAQNGGQGSQRFVIPVLTAAKLEEIRQQLCLPAALWTRVHHFYVVWPTLALGSLLTVAVGLGLMKAGLSPLPSLLAYLCVAAVSFQRWRCLGYSVDGDWLAVKSGFIGRRQQWVPVGKVQKISLNQPPLLKRAGLADLHIWGTDGRLTLPCIPLPEAQHLRDLTLTRVITYVQPWY